MMLTSARFFRLEKEPFGHPRAIRFCTADTCHLPPRGRATPLAFKASAMPARVVTPYARIAAITGITLAAK